MKIKKPYNTGSIGKVKEALPLLAIIIIPLLFRAIYFFQIKANPFFIPLEQSLDPYIYDRWASEIAGGDWLGHGAFAGMPFYAYFLGLIYKVIGHKVAAAIIVQMLIGTASIVLLYKIGKKVFNKNVGVIAAAIATFYSMFMFYEGFLVSVSLEVFLFLFLIFLLLRIAERPSFIGWVFIGVVLSCAILTRASVLLFLGFLVFWIIFSLKGKFLNKIVYIAGLLGAVAVILGAVTVRNYIVSKDLIFITSHSGINFYIGNNPDADGTFMPPRYMVSRAEGLFYDAKLIAEKEEGKSLKPSHVSKFWYDRAFDFIRKEPLRYAGLVLRKKLLFSNGDEIYDVMNYDFFKRYSSLLRFPWVNFRVVFPLALLGIALSLKQGRKLLLLYFIIISHSLSIILFFVNSRLSYAGCAVFHNIRRIRGLLAH